MPDIREIFGSASGVVIGENHSSIAPKKFLIQNFSNLASMGYTVLFLEHLSAEEQPLIDRYYEDKEDKEDKKMPKELKDFLDNLDEQHMDWLCNKEEIAESGFSAIVKAAKISKIKIVCLEESRAEYGKQINRDRILKFNSQAVDVIRRELAKKANLKWIAFVGTAHVNEHTQYRVDSALPMAETPFIGGIVNQLKAADIKPAALTIFNPKGSEIFLKQDYECFVNLQKEAKIYMPRSEYDEKSLLSKEGGEGKSILQKIETISEKRMIQSPSFNILNFLLLNPKNDLSFDAIGSRDFDCFVDPKPFVESIVRKILDDTSKINEAKDSKAAAKAAAEFSSNPAANITTKYPAESDAQYVLPPAKKMKEGKNEGHKTI